MRRRNQWQSGVLVVVLAAVVVMPAVAAACSTSSTTKSHDCKISRQTFNSSKHNQHLLRRTVEMAVMRGALRLL